MYVRAYGKRGRCGHHAGEDRFVTSTLVTSRHGLLVHAPRSFAPTTIGVGRSPVVGTAVGAVGAILWIHVASDAGHAAAVGVGLSSLGNDNLDKLLHDAAGVLDGDLVGSVRHLVGDENLRSLEDTEARELSNFLSFLVQQENKRSAVAKKLSGVFFRA